MNETFKAIQHKLKVDKEYMALYAWCLAKKKIKDVTFFARAS